MWTKILVDHEYLQLPVKNEAKTQLITLKVQDRIVRQFKIELSPTREQADFWTVTPIGEYKGESLTMEIDEPCPGFSLITQGDSIPDSDDLYRAKYRPQYHFTARRGWINDPNGLVYYDGEYHLFFQHNPFGIKHGNMTWGHAVSRDLVHWEELDDALHPDELGTMFSGSGVIDENNTADFQIDRDKAMVCIYTAAGGRLPMNSRHPFTQSIAYSLDRGRSWIKYENNPVLEHLAGRNRDPKVIWHAPTSRWVMVLYMDGHDYAIFTSPDLISWQRTCDVVLPGCSECPDLFELPVDGNHADKRWVFWGANGTYRIGVFDGEVFLTEGVPQRYDWGGTSYAAQTWSGMTERRIQIAWLRGDIPGMPFNQQMAFPCQLTLRSTDEGVRLFAEPVQEIERLRKKTWVWERRTVKPEENLLAGLRAELLDIQAEIDPGDADHLGFMIRGIPVQYDVQECLLTCGDGRAQLKPEKGTIRLRVLVDRASVEVFGNDGRVYVPISAVGEPGMLEFSCQGGDCLVHTMGVHELR